MTPDKYKHLEQIFTRFNNEVAIFYSDLMDILPDHKPMILDQFHVILTNSNLLFKQAADLLFTKINK